MMENRIQETEHRRKENTANLESWNKDIVQALLFLDPTFLPFIIPIFP
jgi:hypothetical protein